jgi:hypothetical protein
MKPWDEIRPDLLTFPIGGKVYTIPELAYDAMLTIQRAKAGETTYLDGMSAEETWRLVMGGAWDEMVTDNVPAEAIARAGFATLAYFELGADAAESIWENGIDPKALAEAMTRRASQPEPSSTDAASATPSPEPSSGMSSPRRSPRKSPAAKKTVSPS